MGLFRKRIVLPSALICILAALYFALKILCAGGYVTAFVVDALSKKFNCDVKIDGACLSYNRLTISGLTFSYRKAGAIHEVARIGTLVVHFSPGPFFHKGVFHSVDLNDVALTVERDREGWLTFGRIVEPRASLATKSFPMTVQGLRIFVENKCIPVTSAALKVTSAWPKVNVELVEAVILNGKADGRGWFAMEEDPRLDASLTIAGIALQDPSLPPAPGDLRLKGAVSCNLIFGGTASSPFLLKDGSWLTAKDVSASMGDRGPIFETDVATLTLQRREGKTTRAEIKVNLGKTLLNVTPWIHSRDTPDHLLVREKIEGLFRGCPDFAAALLGANTRLVYETFTLPLDSFSGEALSVGNTVMFRDIKAAIGRSRIDASWRHQGADAMSTYDGHIKVSDLDITRLIEGTSLQNRKMRGVLSGELRFAQAPTAGGGPKGEGSLRIANAEIWSLPIFELAAREAKLPPNRPRGPAQLIATFDLDKDMLRFTQIDFKDETVTITGAGEVYHSGEVDLELQVTSKEPRQKNVPVIDDLVGVFDGALAAKPASIHVTGTFIAPVATSAPPRPAGRNP
ncbi:MAG: hypothetical protein AB1696_16530 [Planctomycetota bacterium]